MNITDNIIRIKEGKDNIIQSLKNKGVEISDNTLINEIPTIIDNAEIGGGDTPSQPDIPELTPKYEGASVFRIVVPTDNYEFAINLCNDATKATYDVDWGDGSLESGLTTNEQHHTYSKKGTYDVNIYNLSKDITLGGSYSVSSSSVTIYYLFNNTNNDYWLNKYIYQKDNTTVTNILIGDKITSISKSAFTGCSSLTYIDLPSTLTSIGDYTFSNCSSLQSIVIPDSVTTIGSSAFYECSSLQSIVIPDSVTTIGSSAFSNCSSLQNIVIPDSVTTIGERAFYYCRTLKSIVIPNSVTSIGKQTFYYCSILKSIVIPNSVTSIGEEAFYECSSLQNIVIPEGVTSIDKKTFYYCRTLKSIVIPNSVTYIGLEVFYGCSSLQNIVIPDSVTTIGNSSFEDCSSLQSVVMSEGVTSISYYGFRNCSSLTNIVIPDSVTTIGERAFNGCSSLTNIVIPDSVTTIRNYAFYECSSLQSITCEAMTAPTIQSSSFPTSSFKYSKRYLYVPKESTGYNEGNWKTYLIDKGWELRYIEDYPKTPTTLKLKTTNNFFHKWGWLGQAKLIDYELINNEYIYNFDDKITDLLSNTFYKTVLEEIELPEGVEVLGDNLFYEAFKLSTVNIPSTVTSIGKYCFYRTTIKEMTIPEGITLLPDGMCDTCLSLNTVNIPSTVTSIGKRCFIQNSRLNTITCKAMQAPTIQSDTFNQVGYNVPSGTPKILRIPQGSSGYEETTSQWYIQLIAKGYKLEYIVPNTLNYTSYSGDIVTPYAESFEGKNEIVSNVYENGIGTVTFKEGLTEIYDDMYNTDLVGELRSIEIPNTITRIGDYSFRSQYLTTLNVPDSVTEIGDSAFNGCTKLIEITLGSGVETIGQWAFSGCTQVATLTCMAMVAPSINQSFLSVGLNVSGDKILRVPQGAEGYDTWLSQLNGFTIEYIN